MELVTTGVLMPGHVDLWILTNKNCSVAIPWIQVGNATALFIMDLCGQ